MCILKYSEISYIYLEFTLYQKVRFINKWTDGKKRVMNKYSKMLMTEHVFVQSLGCDGLFATPWAAVRQTSLSFTISWTEH